MPLLKRWEENGALWGIWKVSETPHELRARLTAASCDDTELESYKSASRRMEYLSVRVLLHTLLGKESRISHHPSGQPYLADAPFHISISHTKGYVAIGLHPQREVGIDIEQVSERVRKVTTRFVRPDECSQLAASDPQTQLYQLLILWSAKETLYKVLHRKEVDFLEHLHIHPFAYQPGGGEMKGQEYRTDAQREYQLHYLIHPDFVCTFVLD